MFSVIKIYIIVFIDFFRIIVDLSSQFDVVYTKGHCTRETSL